MLRDGKSKSNLHFVLISFTLLFIAAQIAFLLIHHQINDLLDSLIKISIVSRLSSSSIVIPILIQLSLHLFAYLVFLTWVLFLTNNIALKLKLTQLQTYFFGIFIWITGISSILGLNTYFYPQSFFALPLMSIPFFISTVICICMTLIAYYYFLKFHKRSFSGWFLIIIISAFIFLQFYENNSYKIKFNHFNKPNIIIIGFDSLRPDYINRELMPALKTELDESLIYSSAYTPLARTFPAWISLLTAAYPKNTNVRANLMENGSLENFETIAQRLQQNGYETFYATDESRYTDITSKMGFDHIISTKPCAAEFLLATFYDFPMTNLLLRLPGAAFLFPYNFANRAADITYYPQDFLHLLVSQLRKHEQKPVFLSIHLTLSHWPFTWAEAHKKNVTKAELYQNSLITLDKQFQQLNEILKNSGLLNNAVVFFISDHGVTFGMPNDRWIRKEKYIGNKDNLKLVNLYQLASADQMAPIKYVLHTSYGQGTDVLSMPQFKILLALKSYGIKLPGNNLNKPVSLMDIAPTILDILQLPKMNYADGASLLKDKNRLMFFETADTFAGMEQENIDVKQVAKNALQIYEFNNKNGGLFIKPAAYQSLLKQKQRAIILNNWLLARYPETQRLIIANRDKLPKNYKLRFNLQTRQYEVESNGKYYKLIFKKINQKPYYVLLNLQNKQWTVNFAAPFARTNEIKNLLNKFQNFYSNEIDTK